MIRVRSFGRVFHRLPVVAEGAPPDTLRQHKRRFRLSPVLRRNRSALQVPSPLRLLPTRLAQPLPHFVDDFLRQELRESRPAGHWPALQQVMRGIVDVGLFSPWVTSNRTPP